MLQKFGDSTKDAWLLICNLFGLDSYQHTIMTNSESSSIRFTDAIHRLYHRSPNITWDMIRAEVVKYDPKMAKDIDEYKQQAKKFMD